MCAKWLKVNEIVILQNEHSILGVRAGWKVGVQSSRSRAGAEVMSWCGPMPIEHSKLFAVCISAGDFFCLCVKLYKRECYLWICTGGNAGVCVGVGAGRKGTPYAPPHVVSIAKYGYKSISRVTSRYKLK